MVKIKNKNDIPVLSTDEEIHEAFLKDNDVIHVKNNSPKKVISEFEQMLEESLFGLTRKTIVQKKNDSHVYRKKKSVQRIVNRYPEPQESLDLHGFTAGRADEKIQFFIRESYKKGLMTVRIIVGKGLHSEGGAILPDIAEDRISKWVEGNMVLSYKWEKKIKKKSGALIVFLKYNNEVK